MISILFSALIGLIIGCTSSMFSRNKHFYARFCNIMAATLGSLLLASIISVLEIVVPVLVVAVVGALVSLMALVKYRRTSLNKFA